jgi:hypothetical protein
MLHRTPPFGIGGTPYTAPESSEQPETPAAEACGELVKHPQALQAHPNYGQNSFSL